VIAINIFFYFLDKIEYILCRKLIKSFLQVSLTAVYVTMTSSGTAVPERQIPAVSHVTTHWIAKTLHVPFDNLLWSSKSKAVVFQA